MRKKIRKNYRIAKYIVYRQTIVEPSDHFWSFVGAFIGIGSVGFLQQSGWISSDVFFLIGSFGASAVLVFGATNSPLAQPRNLVLGHLVCALIGVSVFKIIPDTMWLSSALAVSLSIVAMQMTKSTHPPGGATALIANIGTEKIKNLGYYYVFFPVLSGALILLLVALIVNNIPKNRIYPYRKIPGKT